MHKKLFVLMIGLLLSGCAGQPSAPPEAVGVQDVLVDMGARQQTLLMAFPVDGTQAVIAPADLWAFDKERSADGNGALKITVPGKEALTVPLYETALSLPGDAPLIVQAKVLTQDGFSGQVFVELAGSPGKNRPFATQGIASGVGNTKGQWVAVESPFYPGKGRKPPARFRVSVTVAGPGTVWVDDIRLLSTPPSTGEVSGELSKQ